MAEIPSKSTEAARRVPADGLPIFRWEATEYAAYYAPGCLCVVDLSQAEQFEARLNPTKQPLDKPESAEAWGERLWRRAEDATRRARELKVEPFHPECLTLYLNNGCNLHCAYCYAAPPSTPLAHPPGQAGERLALDAIAGAAEVVAKNCRDKGRALYVVVHGGGEPTLHWQLLAQALDLVEGVARSHGVGIYRYLATNGVMPEQNAVWLAHRFDLVGLSCDGPADIHNRQRVRWDGKGTLDEVERTAHVLREEGCPFHVRATITPASMDRQAEIVDYVWRQMAPQEIHFEPVYCGGRQSPACGFSPHHADEYVEHFLEAKATAWRHQVPLVTSGSRLGSIHGRYCNVFRQVLNLVPGGVATACFKASHTAPIHDKGLAIGTLLAGSDRFQIDHDQVDALRQKLGTEPPACTNCFNRYHCARDCPDWCPLEEGGGEQAPTAQPGFRCRVLKSVALTVLRQTAATLWSEVCSGLARAPHGTYVT